MWFVVVVVVVMKFVQAEVVQFIEDLGLLIKFEILNGVLWGIKVVVLTAVVGIVVVVVVVVVIDDVIV